MTPCNSTLQHNATSWIGDIGEEPVLTRKSEKSFFQKPRIQKLTIVLIKRNVFYYANWRYDVCVKIKAKCKVFQVGNAYIRKKSRILVHPWHLKEIKHSCFLSLSWSLSLFLSPSLALLQYDISALLTYHVRHMILCIVLYYVVLQYLVLNQYASQCTLATYHVSCNVLQCAAVCCSVLVNRRPLQIMCVAVCYNMLQIYLYICIYVCKYIHIYLCICLYIFAKNTYVTTPYMWRPTHCSILVWHAYLVMYR